MIRCQIGDLFCVYRAAIQQRRQFLGCIELQHPHGILDDLAVPAHLHSHGIPGYRHHVHI